MERCKYADKHKDGMGAFCSAVGGISESRLPIMVHDGGNVLVATDFLICDSRYGISITDTIPL